MTVPGMFFTVVMCLRMTGPCLKVFGLVVGWGCHLREDGKMNEGVLWAWLVWGQSRDTQSCLSPTLILCFLSFSHNDPLVSSRSLSSCCYLFPSQ